MFLLAFNSNPGMNFLNEFNCELSFDVDACSPIDPSDEWVSLSYKSLKKIYQATNSDGSNERFVYVVDGLRQEKGKVPYESPCTPGEASRVSSFCCTLICLVSFVTKASVEYSSVVDSDSVHKV